LTFFDSIWFDEICISKKVHCANSFKQRLLGLFAYKKLDKDECLVLFKCSSIHTFFMSYSISVVFLSKSNQILKVVDKVKPFRAVWCHNADKAVEFLAQDLSSECKVGGVMRFNKK